MEEREQAPWRRALDRLLTGPKGMTVALLLLFSVLALTVWGANYPSELLQALFDRGYTLLSRLLAFLPEAMRGFFLEGMYRICSRVLAVMLPPMVIFYFLFSLLEDVGYLPRLARLLEKPMGIFGGCGRQGVSLCMGLGCNAVGVMGCSQIGCPRQRLRGILTNAMVPCNGRFPALIALTAVLFPGVQALGVMLFVLLGMLGAVSVSGLMSLFMKKSPEKAQRLPLPPLKKPKLRQLLGRGLGEKAWEVARSTLLVAAPAGGLLWVLTQVGILPAIARALEPVGVLLGMNGTILTAFFLSFPANELFLPSMLLMAGERGLLFSWNTALCTLVFTLFHWPCATTLLTIHRQTGSIKITAAAFFLPTAVGVVLCMLLNGLCHLVG